MTSDFEGFLYQIFLFLMLSAKQGKCWYHFYYVFGMTLSLTREFNPGPPALVASTIPLGYRGGCGVLIIFHQQTNHPTKLTYRLLTPVQDPPNFIHKGHNNMLFQQLTFTNLERYYHPKSNKLVKC